MYLPLTNLGGLLIRQNHPAEAIAPLERTASIFHRIAKPREEAQAFNNLGEVYYRLRRFDKAVDIFQKSIQINHAFNIPENLINDYSGLSDVYEAQGNLRKALDFTILCYDLNDSIVGAKTQLEIADLEARSHGQQNELAIQKSQSQLANARLSLQMRMSRSLMHQQKSYHYKVCRLTGRCQRQVRVLMI